MVEIIKLNEEELNVTRGEVVNKQALIEQKAAYELELERLNIEINKINSLLDYFK